jgi:hypothetical protein
VVSPPARKGPGSHDRVEDARTRILKAAIDQEISMMPLELSTLLLLGGEQGIDDVAEDWTNAIGMRWPERVPTSILDAVASKCAESFALDADVAAVARLIVESTPSRVARVSEWRELAVGQRAQVLLHLALVLAAGSVA